MQPLSLLVRLGLGVPLWRRRSLCTVTSPATRAVSKRLQELRKSDPAADVARFLRGSNESRAAEVYSPQEVEAAKARPVLHDSFGRQHTYLRISVTERCNLRCTYCMPEAGVALQPADHLLTSDEIVKIASAFVAMGVNKIRLTGGEVRCLLLPLPIARADHAVRDPQPTVRRDIVALCSRLSTLPGLRTLAMTTNGLVLPRMLPSLQQAGVTHFNISLDTLKPERFEKITRRAGFTRVLDAIHAAVRAGYAPVKVRMTCGMVPGVRGEVLLLLHVVGPVCHPFSMWAKSVWFLPGAVALTFVCVFGLVVCVSVFVGKLRGHARRERRRAH